MLGALPNTFKVPVNGYDIIKEFMMVTYSGSIWKIAQLKRSRFTDFSSRRLWILPVLVLCVVCAASLGREPLAGRLERLRVLKPAQHPRTHFFRVTEQSARADMSWHTWHEKFCGLMGIEGKVLSEEVLGNNDRILEFFQRYKSEHTEHLVLLHFNGRSRDPIFEREPFFAGHWIYYNGAKILEDVPATSSITDIKVSDSSLFRTKISKNKNEDIGLCELDGQGRPNWHLSEQVKLIKVDRQRGIIRVQRGCYGTSPRAFRAGRSCAAAHVTKGPFGSKSNLIWLYNFSTISPRDSNGKQAREILAEQLAGWFAPGGALEDFDGIEFDAMRHVPNVPDIDTSATRGLDLNADGKIDKGVFGGIQTYGVGVFDFLKDIRARLGEDRLIMADGARWYHQRGFGILNGMESEMFPTGGDESFNDWSGGINRFLFWSVNSREPVFQYIARPESETMAGLRLIFAAALMTDAGVAPNWFVPKAEPNEPIGLWDELRKGTENELAWLGKALGPAKHLAMDRPNLLAKANLSWSNSVKGWIRPINCSVKVNDGTILLRPKPGNAGPLRFQLCDVPCDGPDIFVSATVTASPMTGYPKEIARLMYAAVAGSEVEPVMGPKIVPNMTWVNSRPFTSGFYFKELSDKRVTLSFSIEGRNPVNISKLTVHAAPDVMVRRFEHALVLANPAPHKVTLDLSRIWPGERFSHIKGSPNQDTRTNNGRPVGNTVTLGLRDGLFLIRETSD